MILQKEFKPSLGYRDREGGGEREEDDYLIANKIISEKEH